MLRNRGLLRRPARHARPPRLKSCRTEPSTPRLSLLERPLPKRRYSCSLLPYPTRVRALSLQPHVYIPSRLMCVCVCGCVFWCVCVYVCFCVCFFVFACVYPEGFRAGGQHGEAHLQPVQQHPGRHLQAPLRRALRGHLGQTPPELGASVVQQVRHFSSAAFIFQQQNGKNKISKQDRVAGSLALSIVNK